MADDTELATDTMRASPTASDEAVVETGQAETEHGQRHEENDIDNDNNGSDKGRAIVLNPDTAARQIYSDLFSNNQREIWRPGDGDGDRLGDYFDRRGPAVPFEQRWRFYQSCVGSGPIKRGVNEPPKYVILDDRAAYEILASDLPRANLTRYWPHDFCGPGKIRTRRPHRGRGAVGDADATGIDQYHFVELGTRDGRYYFTGQAGYQPIVYRDAGGTEGSTNESTRLAADEPDSSSGIATKHHEEHFQRTSKRKLGMNAREVQALSDGVSPRISTPESRSTNVSLLKSALKRTRDEIVSDSRGDTSMWIEWDEYVSVKRPSSGREWTSPEPYPSRGEASSGTEESLFRHPCSPDARVSEPTPNGQSMTQEKAQPQDFFAQFLSEQGPGDGPAAESIAEPVVDSGAYAARLEVELVEAQEKIGEQAIQIAELRNARERADEKVEQLMKDIAVLQNAAGRSPE